MLRKCLIRNKFWAAAVAGSAVLWLGCSSAETPPTDKEQAQVTDKQPEKAPPPPKPDPGKLAAAELEKAAQQLEKDDLAAAAASLAKSQAVFEAGEKMSDEQQAQYDGLQKDLAGKRLAKQAADRAENLAQAETLLASLTKVEQLEDVVRGADGVLKDNPTEEERKKANDLLAEVERRRKAMAGLRIAMQMLGSSKAAEVRSAQNKLNDEADTAMPLLFEALRSKDNTLLVKNTLELLRRMKRPDVTLPQMVGVIERTDQQESWPAAAAEIGRVAAPGAGEPLLKLAVSTQVPEQRAAALSALSGVQDPPVNTVAALLPSLYQDGPELATALGAFHHAVRVHRQHDLLGRRALETSLTPEEDEKLATLPARLAQIIEAGTSGDGLTPAAQGAKALSIALRFTAPEPLTGVTVYSVKAEIPESPGSAVLDGKWNGVELPSMWRHPIDQPGTITLDLGAERTVVGVRIWNFNEPGGMHRGWKDIEVYVSSQAQILEPSSVGVLPPAPGAADPPDYSTVLPVEFVKGRYVKLQAKSLWRPDVNGGLTEVQVLGF